MRTQAGANHCKLHRSQPRLPRSLAFKLRNSPRHQQISLAADSSNVAATAEGPASKAATMTVYFRDEDVSTTAAAGDDLIDVAAGCGVIIPTGCWSGNCGVCEVEVYKYTGNAIADRAATSSPAVVRACITKLPPGYSRIEVAQMQDAIWGLDGYDT